MFALTGAAPDADAAREIHGTRMAKTAKKTTTRRTPAPKKASVEKPSAGSGKKLVVVESPAKAKTINRYLGMDYIVKASMGHVRDLPPKEMGVDLENGDFTPTYELLAGRRKVLTELKRYARTAPEVFLATDLDREGEAIAWHLAESLGVRKDRIRRVIFNEITAPAIQEAFADPHDIDMDKVNAQQARRILDRIVGYKVSPLLWKKVARGLSAGRVQTVAVRLIVDREREIDAFDPEEYWKIPGIFTPDTAAAADLACEWAAFIATRDEKGNPPTLEAQQGFLTDHQAFRAELVQWGGEKFKSDKAEEAVEAAKALGLIVEDLERTEDPKGKGVARNRIKVIGQVDPSGPAYTIQGLRQRDSRSRPPAPFTTATLQQSASVRLHYSASRTMRTAQALYEGIEVAGEGTVGLITYMRTDSRQLSGEAIKHVRGYIQDTFGEKYLPEKPNIYTSGGRAQEAHEAIRPTDVTRRPEDLRSVLREDQFRLYRLIWEQFVACQMPPAVWTVTEVDILPEGVDAAFKAMGRRLAFDGFLRVTGLPRGGNQILPDLADGQAVAPLAIRPSQHFTQAPPRFTEASLVKSLEADGIGRPSTYASIIQTIQDREYVKQVDRSFHPTDLGIVVTDKLVGAFPELFDVRFTAHMEDELDKIEESGAEWASVLREFYGPFSERLAKAADEMVHARAETQPSDYTCESCGKEMVYRFSRNGRYLACTGYPECKTTHPVDKEGKKLEQMNVDLACPKCSSPMMLRRGRYGPFLSCTRYPDCDGVLNLDRKGFVKLPSAPPLQVELACPKCESPLYLRRGKRGPWLGCSKYPKCRGRMGWKALKEDQQKDLDLQLMNHEKDHPQPALTTLDGTPIGDQHIPTPLAPDPSDKPDPSTSSE